MELAGSQRKQGEYISQVVNSVYENRQAGEPSLAMEAIRHQMLGMVAELGELRGRLAALEQR